MDNSHGYLPKNKALIATTGAIAVLAIAGVIFFQFSPDSEGDVSDDGPAPTVASSGENGDELEQDTDGDGLRDWEEILWGTDAENRDTDGDGTTDGDEVTANRDPAVAAPGDELSGNASSTTPTASEIAAAEDLTQEDAAARNFFARFLELRRSGNIDANDARRLGQMYQQEMLGETGREVLRFNVYTQSDITVTQNSDQQAIRRYGNAMGRVIENAPSVPESRTELPIYLEAIESGADEDFERITPYIERYDAIIQNSFEVAVPETAVETHLGYMNAMRALRENAKAMRSGQTNPVQSLSYFQRYANNVEDQVINSLLEVRQYFRANNVTFTRNEPGYIVTNFSSIN